MRHQRIHNDITLIVECTVWPGRCCWHCGWQETGCWCLFVRGLTLRYVCVSPMGIFKKMFTAGIKRLCLLSLFTKDRKFNKIHADTFSSSLYFTDLEVRALAQNVMADVQMVLRWLLGSFILGLTLCCGHPKLTSLGERLEVVRRHCPEVKVRLIPKQPAVCNNIASAWINMLGSHSSLLTNDHSSRISQPTPRCPPSPLHIPLPFLPFIYFPQPPFNISAQAHSCC